MPARVLVVDDDDGIRHLVGTVLKRADFETEEARHGGEAINLLQSKPYDVIVLDLMMPVVSGFEVIDWIADHAPETLKCVVVVSAAPRRDLKKLDGVAVFKVVPKPFDLNDLLKTVEECSSGSSSEAC